MGLENIAMNNGWSQALLGASIVMTGLIVLSVAISQIHKLVDFWENRSKKEEPLPSGAASMKEDASSEIPDQCPADITQTAALYKPLVDQLASTFELKDLYQRAEQADLPHPHITIRCLREAGILTTTGDGLFSWNQ